MNWCRGFLVIFFVLFLASCGGGGGDGEGENSGVTSGNTNGGVGNNTDADNDGVADSEDAFPQDPNESVDTDGDGVGNNADTDDDNDGVEDSQDAFPLDASESIDTDADGMGNNADTDDDNDGVEDSRDAFPLDASESIDTDADGTGNKADADDDNDGVEDSQDAFPLDASESVDTDADGTGNNADTDDDNDGVEDSQDAFPLDSFESIDTDGDGIGNNADNDDDNDGVQDNRDDFPLDSSESVDTDGDGVGDNADAYADQGACHLEGEGDGTECYATLLPAWGVDDVTASEDGYIFFFVDSQNVIVIFDIYESNYSTVAINQIDNEYFTEMAYSNSAERLYLGFSNGRIAYLDVDTQQIQEFSSTAESVSGLVATGNYLMAQDDSGAWGSHYIFDNQGNQTDWVEWNQYSGHFAWNETLSRVYYFQDGFSPNDILFEEVNQLTGVVTASGESPYHGDYSISGPIVVSSTGTQIFLGAGDIYDAGTLEYEGSIGFSVDDALWSSPTGLVVFKQLFDSVRLTRFDSALAPVENLSIKGTLIAAFQQLERGIILVENQGVFEFIDFVANDDVDGDGIANQLDAFPNDAAISLDTDNDGWPDAWNDGYSESDINIDIVLDAFPNDAICQLEEHGVEGVCDIASRVQLISADDIVIHNDVVYALSSADMRVNRWKVSTEEYLNPILLEPSSINGAVLSIAVDSNDQVLVGYDAGYIYRYPVDGLGLPEYVTSFSAAVTDLFVTENHYLAVVGDGFYYRDYIVLSEEGNTSYTYLSGRNSNDYAFSPATQRFYWFRNTYSDSLESAQVNGLTGDFNSFESYYYSGSPTSFMSVSNDEQLVVTGDRTVIENYLDSPSTFVLPASLSLSENAELMEFSWLNEVAVALFEENENSALTIYSPDLAKAYVDMPQDDKVLFMQAYDGELLMLVETDSNLRFESLALEADADQDGIPFWWEFAYGLNDQEYDDSLVDSDEDDLTNLQEYEALTLPNNADTDADGLNDGDEVALSLNPLVTDSDGDFMPDGWEVANGLDGNDPADAGVDSDNDGVSNYHEYLSGTDPQDSDSTPENLSDVLYSFEDSMTPDEWVINVTPTFSSASAYDGVISMEISDSATIEWSRLFAGVELNLYLTSNCYSRYDKRIKVEVDGEEVTSQDIQQAEWQKVQALIPNGYHDVSVTIESYDSSCSVYLDAVSVLPLPSIFEMGAKMVMQRYDRLFIYNMESELIRNIPIPGQLDFSDYARDISVLDDGRIAVFNGTFSPVLSYYDPETHVWEHIQAPAWSTVNNGTYGGIDAIGSRVFATNMSTSGNSAAGIVEFDLADHSVDYVDGPELIDLTIGLDEFIYGLSSSNVVHKYDPGSLSLVDSVAIGEARSIAVDADGDIYTATWNGPIEHYDSEGNLLNSLSAHGNFYDVALRANGEIIFSNSSQDVFVTDTSLAAYTQLQVEGEFVDFVPDIDTDTDGLPDWWEGGFGLDANDPADAAMDLDEDGLTALEEYALGTHENTLDTDGDGLSDGDEYLSIGSDPLDVDTDKDGLEDGVEVDLGTSPVDVDSDDDGLSDTDEHLETGTDPIVADTDADGMKDGYEVEFGLDAFVDDASLDLDDDLLSNLEEHDAQTNPNVADTDGDALNDYDELFVYATSPILADTDGDKLRDGWEVTYGLDANDPATASVDRDNDQFSNLEEYYADTNPIDNTSFPQPIEWQTHQGDAQHTGYTPFILNELDFAFKWSSTIDNVSALNPVSASQSQVFLSSDSHYGHQSVYSLNAITGEIQWEMNFPDISSLNAPSHSDGRVYFQTGGHGDSFIRSVDAETGELIFESSYGNQWSRYLAPTIYDGSVYMAGGYFGGVYAFDAQSGNEEWFASGPQYDEFTPAVDENYVYAFTTHLDILDRITGDVVSSIDFPDFGWSGYDVDVATVLTREANVVATQGGTLVVFDTVAENILWQRTNAGFNGQASVANGNIYAIANGSLYVIDEFSGENLWVASAHSYESNIIVTKTHVFVGDGATTYALDIETQEEVWSYPAAGHLSLGADGSLYIAGSSLVAISLQ